MANTFSYYCNNCGRKYPNEYADHIYKTAFKTIDRENYPIGSCKDYEANYEKRENIEKK